jgi:hypothetical protein
MDVPGRRDAPWARRLAADDAALAYAIKTAKPGTTEASDPAIRTAATNAAIDPATYFPVMERLDPSFTPLQ